MSDLVAVPPLAQKGTAWVEGWNCVYADDVRSGDLVRADFDQTRVGTGGGLYLVEEWRDGEPVWRGCPYSGPPVTRLVTDGYNVVDQASQGEIDEPAVMALVRLLGSAFGIPTTQAIRSYRGWEAWTEGNAPASAVLFGPPAKD